MADEKRTPVKNIREFFGMNLADMKREWMGKEEGYPQLTEQDKAELTSGLAAFYDLDLGEQTKALNTPKLIAEHKEAGVLTYA